MQMEQVFHLPGQSDPSKRATRASLLWWMRSPTLWNGTSFLPIRWTVVTTVASLPGWGGVLGLDSTQGRWTPREARLPINILELQAIRLSLTYWTDRIRGLPKRIQSDAVAYANQGGKRSAAATLEMAYILRWTEKFELSLSRCRKLASGLSQPSDTRSG